jgi:hypothetical protein
MNKRFLKLIHDVCLKERTADSFCSDRVSSETIGQNAFPHERIGLARRATVKLVTASSFMPPVLSHLPDDIGGIGSGG